VRRFDLVIGADGLHSRVRSLAFGVQDRFEVQFGYQVAAFEVVGYRPRNEQVYIIFNEPGRMLGRFALHEDRTLFLFVFTSGEGSARTDLPGQKALLRARYGDGQWECPRILDELDHTKDLYFDRVSQIRMNTWSKGRVALVGDAAFCVSLMAGQGSALGMTAAYVLAGELAKAQGRQDEAFRTYEALLRAFIASKQSGAAHLSAAFAPKTRLGLFLRNQVIKSVRYSGSREIRVRPRNQGYPAAPPIFLARAFRLSADIPSIGARADGTTERWRQPRLEVPRRDPDDPDVVAQQPAARQRWRARQRVRDAHRRAAAAGYEGAQTPGRSQR
jgi:2-polyprenyl-6-methoxyphenol hydroxylase-like FAD-dependent oxidoreductase